MEFGVDMDFNETTFEIINNFRNLKVLSIGWISDTRLLDTATFPPTLRRIKFGYIQISCSNFLLIVEQLKLLEEFDLGDGYIFCDHDKCKLLHPNLILQSHNVSFTCYYS